MTKNLRSLARWAQSLVGGYRRSMSIESAGTRKVAPVARPAEFAMYEGLWVAVVDGKVEAAEETSHRLALKLHGMDLRKRRRAVVEYVRPTGDTYIIGVG